MAEDTRRSASPEESRDALLDQLGSANRRRRQEASHQLAIMAKYAPDVLIDHADALEEALFLPEAQTRWECLDALADLAEHDPAKVLGAFEGAEASLFDEDSAAVRLAAFRFIARVGATSPEHSDKAWPLLDEAIQCFHGDPEYRDMLQALIEFVKGDISDEARDALVARVDFDANKGSSAGYIRAYSRQIIDEAKAAAKR